MSARGPRSRRPGGIAITSSPWLDTLILFLLVGVPVGIVFWYMRRPYDEGSVPRDILASKAKGQAIGPGLFVWPTKSYRKSLIDTADDAGHDKDFHDDTPERFDSNDFTDTDEHRAQVVKDLKRGR